MSVFSCYILCKRSILRTILCYFAYNSTWNRPVSFTVSFSIGAYIWVTEKFLFLKLIVIIREYYLPSLPFCQPFYQIKTLSLILLYVNNHYLLGSSKYICSNNIFFNLLSVSLIYTFCFLCSLLISY